MDILDVYINFISVSHRPGRAQVPLRRVCEGVQEGRPGGEAVPALRATDARHRACFREVARQHTAGVDRWLTPQTLQNYVRNLLTKYGNDS